MKLKLGAAMMATLIVASSVAQAADEGPSAEVLGRGKLLTMIGGCQDCHTPKTFGPKGPEVDWTRELSGHPAGDPIPPVDKRALTPGYWALMGPDFTSYVGPWGISYAMNLTPDEQTGIGLWTEEIFVKTMKTGKHMGAGRDILPPMPWYWIKELPDSDLHALFAYLKSVKPIKNAVPAPVAPPDVK